MKRRMSVLKIELLGFALVLVLCPVRSFAGPWRGCRARLKWGKNKKYSQVYLPLSYSFIRLSCLPPIRLSFHWSFYPSFHPFVNPPIDPSVHWSSSRKSANKRAPVLLQHRDEILRVIIKIGGKRIQAPTCTITPAARKCVRRPW